MFRRRLIVFLLLSACTGAVFGVLLSGRPWLERSLPGGLPLGNLLAASIPVALALAAWVAGRARTWQRRGAAAALVAALAWLPVSIALSGNLALDFSGERGAVWLGFSAVVMLAVLVAWAWGAIAGLWRVPRARR